MSVLFNRIEFITVSLMARKCSYHPDTSCYMHGDLTLNLRGKILPRSLNVMSCILGVKWMTKIKDGPLIFVV